MHGTADTIVPFDSGELTGNLAQWVHRNRCAKPLVITYLPDADPNDGVRARVESYGGCRDGADAVLYALEGGGHTLPGGDPIDWTQGNICRDFDAATVIWNFFRDHPRP